MWADFGESGEELRAGGRGEEAKNDQPKNCQRQPPIRRCAVAPLRRCAVAIWGVPPFMVISSERARGLEIRVLAWQAETLASCIFIRPEASHGSQDGFTTVR
jgi:hypothetical protein